MYSIGDIVVAQVVGTVAWYKAEVVGGSPTEPHLSLISTDLYKGKILTPGEYRIDQERTNALKRATNKRNEQQGA